MENKDHLTNQGIAVANAGIVILSSYIPMLFERLGLTSQAKFMNTEAQSKSIYYLQYLATGIADSEEIHLSLNKVLCGLPITAIVKDEVIITDAQKKLMQGLIGAAIAHSNSLGTTSTDGFRGNWLIRNGLLKEFGDKWELTVEKRAYDILLHKAPFTFSIIKFPWMDKPLHVQWLY